MGLGGFFVEEAQFRSHFFPFWRGKAQPVYK